MNEELENAELDAEWLREEIKYLDYKIELLEHKLGNYFEYMDLNELAYWLCFTYNSGKIEELMNEIKLYGGIKND